MKKYFIFVLSLLICLLTFGCVSSSQENVGDFVFVKGKKSMGKSWDDFFICSHEVTQDEWESVMGTYDGAVKGGGLPAVKVSWYMAVIYCNKLSIKDGLSPCYSVRINGNELDWENLAPSYVPGSFDEKQEWDGIICDFEADGYRLPTKAEWDYAAAGGILSQEYKYSGSDVMADVAWYKDNSGRIIHDVMTKAPNELGLYDMEGNVAEWVWDPFSSFFEGESSLMEVYSSLLDGDTELRIYSGTNYASPESSMNDSSLTMSFMSGVNPDSQYDFVGLRLVKSHF
ncbi:MAG: formylglycine-generating enzyme family protein [Treponemataceae bacterium]|nr:formylglycine-generating enzyme family protein [Treponemataceae bacterium]